MITKRSSKALSSRSLASALSLSLYLLGGTAVKGQDSAPASPKPHPVLVELFTSEGCSSCPPADAVLSKIEGKRTATGQLIVGISEHVTYWNRLGWSDPFSAPAYTERQNAYGSRFRLDSVYTPQVVVNGRVQVLGSDADAILRAVQETDRPGPLAIHIADASISGNELTLSYSIRGTAHADANIFAVLAEDSTSSHVLRGENSGRTLSHVSVAKGIFRVGTVKGEQQETVHLKIGPLQPASPGRHLILFAQAAQFGPVLSIDTLSLH